MNQDESTARQLSGKPNLSAIVSSLDLQLEAELVRYQQQTARTSSTHQERAAAKQKPGSKNRGQLAAPASMPEVIPSALAPFAKVSQGSASISSDIEPSQASALSAAPQTPLESYLASSEELLRALVQRQLAPPQKNFWESLITPLGISSMLLVLLTSALLGVILTTSETKPIVNSLLDREATLAEETATTAPLVEHSPNIAQNLSSPITEPEPFLNDAPHSDLASALLAPSLRSQSQEPQVASSLQPRQNPIPVAQIKPNYYYVLIENTDQASLAQVQNIVESAYLVQFPQGVRIQVGAFTKQNDAKNLVEKLVQQNIDASVYAFES